MWLRYRSEFHELEPLANAKLLERAWHNHFRFVASNFQSNGYSVAFSAAFLHDAVIGGEVKVNMREDGVAARANDLHLLAQPLVPIGMDP